LDEPTTGLDPTKREEMWDVVRRLVDDGSTVLLTTQYLDEAEALAHQISVIDTGRVIASGTPDELKRVVGGQTLEIRPTDIARVDDVAAILRRIGDGEPEITRPGVLQVSVDGEAAMHSTLSACAEAGISLTEFSLRLPSLDEVFFTLTGHRRPADDEEAAA
jgi:oleandomycin transport system ATP-binding protein